MARGAPKHPSPARPVGSAARQGEPVAERRLPFPVCRENGRYRRFWVEPSLWWVRAGDHQAFMDDLARMRESAAARKPSPALGFSVGGYLRTAPALETSAPGRARPDDVAAPPRPRRHPRNHRGACEYVAVSTDADVSSAQPECCLAALEQRRFQPVGTPARRSSLSTGTARRRRVVRVRPARRNSSQRRPAPGTGADESTLSGLAPIRVEYDEVPSSEDRSTYHQPRLAAQGEFFLHMHPVRRAKSLLARAKRTR